ncbi:MAG: hypothetical protein QOG63_74 [Thermoleophilaceae bacterium]|nr:hypothetical protein [Thermoleophilaceae bacterium]
MGDTGTMADAPARHIVDEELREPASYLTIRRGDLVYDLYGWAAGRVAEVRIAATRDELFDGLVVDFRGRRLFVDAPEVHCIYEGVVVLGLTVADMSRAVRDRAAPPQWPRGPRRVPARQASEAAAPDDAVGLMGTLSRMYVAGRLSLAALERDVERVLGARNCGDLDAIAGELLAAA